MIFSSEFDTEFHIECLIKAAQNKRNEETMILFREAFMRDSDTLLEVGDVIKAGDFLLGMDGDWYEVLSPIIGETCDSSIFVCRSK